MVSHDGVPQPPRTSWRTMATPIRPDTGSRLAGSILIGSVAAILVAGCGHKQQATLPPVTPQKKVETPVAADTVKRPQLDPETHIQQRPLRSGWIFKASVNVRSAPSTTAPIITKLSRGAEVKLVEKTEQWWKVQLRDTTTAYVHESMVSTERYIDPWTQFKLGGRLADTTLQIVTAVIELKDTPTPSAALTVDDNWSSFSKIRKQRVAQAAFAYWKLCLSKAGYDSKGTVVVMRDSAGVDVAKITGNTGNTTVELLK